MSFQFQQFTIEDTRCAMKVGTDGVLLGAWTDVAGAATIVDLGAGSGLLSLIAAQRNPDARITAVEIDANAAADCKANFTASPWCPRLVALNADALTYKPTHPVDLIISNPPFFDETLQSPDTFRALARHSGTLSPITTLLWAARHLSETGSVAIIFPFQQADEVIYNAEVLHLRERRRLDVSSREGRAPERSLIQFSRLDGCPVRQALAIRDVAGHYTAAYRSLTTELYLHLNP